MDSIKMSIKELLVLSSKLGAHTFFGVADPFRGMTKEEIWSEVAELLVQAERKGLVTVGFDDEITMTELVSKLISTCAFCEKYLTVDSIDGGVLQSPKRLYVCGRNAVTLLQNNAEIELREETPREFVVKLMASDLSDCPETVTTSECITMPQTVLEQARTMSETQARDALQKVGCSSELADLIILGLHQKCKYYALTAVDFRTHRLESFICIIGPQGMVRLLMADGSENLQAEWVTRTILDKALNDMTLFLQASEEG